MEGWFINNEHFNKKENISAKLFLFPYAGGGASVFQNWQNYFENIKLFSAQYPGRENRIRDNPIKDFSVVIESIYSSLLNIVSDEVPYYLFGHSLGTKIVYELALKIKKNKAPSPRGIIISAGRAPCFIEKNPIYNLDDENFIKEIKRFSGTPSEIIENIEIMKIFLPMLRADFILDETYKKTENEKVESPILALMGTEDKELTLQEFLKWNEYTNSTFSHKFIEGEHMFINTNTESVIKEIKEFIKNF